MTTEPMAPLFRAGAAFSIALVAAIILIPRLSKGYNLSHRAKVGLWTGILAMLLWSALTFVPVYPGHVQTARLSTDVALGFLAEEVWVFFGGLGIGIFFALILVGTFSKKHDATS